MRVLVALVGLAALVLGAPCAAQTRSSHEVRIAVPTFLRLRIDDGAPGSVAELPLTIDVAAGIARFDPVQTRIQILANTRWQLTVAFAPAADSEAIELTFAITGEWVLRNASAFAAVLLSGAATCGWREASVQYGLARTPTDGTYGGVITYTLARP